MTTLEGAIDLFRALVQRLPSFEEDEDVISALLARDAIAALSKDAPQNTAESLREADREFIRARSVIAGRFPRVFDPASRGAAADEWWWDPRREPDFTHAA